MKKLRIAILPHLGRPITRYTRASRSRVIYDLVDGLTKRGHDVSLLGTADSKTAAKTIPVAPTGVFMMGLTENDFYRHTSYLVRSIKTLQALQDRFDIVHSHMYPEFLPLTLGSQLTIPMVTTIHTEMQPYLVDALKVFKGAHLVALSQHHRAGAVGVKIDHVVHNGINVDLFSYSPKAKDYFLFVGRIKIVRRDNGEIYDPKGLLTAIEVAKKAKVKLVISGSIEKHEMFDEFIKPKLTKSIRFIGPVSKEAPLSREEVAELYRGAKALLFPIHWEEPFGLVVAEANACGTPVIAFKRGAVPELIKNGVNGYLVDDVDEMVKRIKTIDEIDRKACREAVEVRFAKETMVENYEKVYYDIIQKS